MPAFIRSFIHSFVYCGTFATSILRIFVDAFFSTSIPSSQINQAMETIK
jgi:hypothetical protein